MRSFLLNSDVPAADKREESSTALQKTVQERFSRSHRSAISLAGKNLPAQPATNIFIF